MQFFKLQETVDKFGFWELKTLILFAILVY